MNNPFLEIAALLILISILGVLGRFLKQPFIVSLILAGVLLDPLGLKLSHSIENITLFSKLGITLLLFLVGLKLDIKLIQNLGKVALATGLGQIIFTSVFGYLLCLLLGFNSITSIFIGIALTFSSTIIIVKLLSDKKEVDSLHGQIAIGFLIVQDLFVIIAIVAVSSLGFTGDLNTQNTQKLISLLLFFLFIPLFIFIFTRYISPLIYRVVAKDSELMVTVTVSIALAIAALSESFGFGIELGGLLAGVLFASTPPRDSLSTRLASLRDFLLIFFFIHLGLHLEIKSVYENLVPSLILSAFVLIGNPLIVMFIMRLLKYPKRIGFLSGLTVAQISEFSLLFMALGQSQGYFGKDAVSTVTTVGLITIALSTYMITYSHTLYKWLEPILRVFDIKNSPHSQMDVSKSKKLQQASIILIGLGRYGSQLGSLLLEKNINFIGIDFDPEVIKKWKKKNKNVFYYDAHDPEIAELLSETNAKWIIHTIPDPTHIWTKSDSRRFFINTLKEKGYRGKIALTAHSEAEKKELENTSADLILCPLLDGAFAALPNILE